jgi:hypothetical protein
MVFRLAVHAARRLWPVYVVTVPVLTAALVIHAIRNSVSALAVSTALTLVIGPLIAFGAFNSREYAILPVTRQQYGLARWMLGTVFASLCTTAARTQALNWVPPDERTIPAAVLTGALTDFLLCGACFGIAALVIGSPRLRSICSRLSISPLIVFGVLVAIFAFAFVGVLAMTRENSGAPGLAVWGFVIAGGLTVIGVRDRPSTRFTSMARSAPAPAMRREMAPRPADTGLVGLRLLAARELTWACGTSTGLLAAICVVLALRYRTIFPSDVFLRLFELSIPHVDANDWLPFIVIFGLPWLVLSTRNGLATSLRPLRALPLSATQLNALFIAQSFAYWVWLIVLFGLLCVLTVGRLPHVEAGPVMLCIGITAFAHSTQLFLGRTFSPVIFLLQLFVFELLSVALPFPFDALSHPAPLGLALLSAAAAANLWILRRSTSYHRPETAFLLARREV